MCNIKIQENLYLELSSQQPFIQQTQLWNKNVAFRKDLTNLLMKQNVHVQITYREADPSDAPNLLILTFHDSKGRCLLNLKHAAR